MSLAQQLDALLPKEGWVRFVLAMLLLSLLVSGPANAASETVPVRSITASGLSERKVAPDEAHVVVNFGALDLKLENAKAEHDRKLRTVMNIARSENIETSQIRTESSTIQPHYTWENNKQNFRGYRVQTQVDITVKKIDQVGELIKQLTTAGLETGDRQEWGNLLSTSYVVSNPDKIRDEMLADAIKNARAKAENMASAAGASLGDVIQINEGSAPQFNFPPPMPMMVRAMKAEVASDASGIAPPVGEQSLNANVTVMFELR